MAPVPGTGMIFDKLWFLMFRGIPAVQIARPSSVRGFTICFTICLFMSPDLDGYRAPKGINPTRQTRSRNPNTKCLTGTICLFLDGLGFGTMFHDMFVHPSGLLDGIRLKMSKKPITNHQSITGIGRPERDFF